MAFILELLCTLHVNGMFLNSRIKCCLLHFITMYIYILGFKGMGGVLSFHRRRSHVELADFDFRTKDHEVQELLMDREGVEALEHANDDLVTELVICELGEDITDSISGYVCVDLTGVTKDLRFTQSYPTNLSYTYDVKKNSESEKLIRPFTKPHLANRPNRKVNSVNQGRQIVKPTENNKVKYNVHLRGQLEKILFLFYINSLKT